jgi:exodeoxyribonuclease X
MTIRVIDIETTGTGPRNGCDCRDRSVDILKDGTIANQRSTLVRPAIPVPPESSAVHHLIDEDLAFAPDLNDVLDQFKGADAYVAHDADFERSFLERRLSDVLWACTYKCALRIWPELLSHSNQTLRYRLGLVNPFNIDRHTLSPHRALCDAIVTAAVFNEVVKHATSPEIVRWSSEPALLSVFRFGKYRGERFDAVPEDYLRWIIEGQNELRDDVRTLFALRRWSLSPHAAATESLIASAYRASSETPRTAF